MNERVYQNLLETSWRRELTPAEQARLQEYLSAHPEAQADWQAHGALNKLLRQLPAAPIASNFTAQVLRSVEAEQARQAGRSVLARWWEDWGKVFLPKVAWAAAALLLALGSFLEYRHLERTWIARDLAKIPVGVTLPSPESLQDFDAIQQLCKVPTPPSGDAAISDEDLLNALR